MKLTKWTPIAKFNIEQRNGVGFNVGAQVRIRLEFTIQDAAPFLKEKFIR